MLFNNPCEHVRSRSEEFSDVDGQFPSVTNSSSLFFVLLFVLSSVLSPDDLKFLVKIFSREVIPYPTTCEMYPVDAKFNCNVESYRLY